MKKLYFYQIFCLCFTLNLHEAFATLPFTFFEESQRIKDLRSSKSYYNERELLESSQRFYESSSQKDKRFAKRSSQRKANLRSSKSYYNETGLFESSQRFYEPSSQKENRFTELSSQRIEDLMSSENCSDDPELLESSQRFYESSSQKDERFAKRSSQRKANLRSSKSYYNETGLFESSQRFYEPSSQKENRFTELSSQRIEDLMSSENCSDDPELFESSQRFYETYPVNENELTTNLGPQNSLQNSFFPINSKRTQDILKVSNSQRSLSENLEYEKNLVSERDLSHFPKAQALSEKFSVIKKSSKHESLQTSSSRVSHKRPRDKVENTSISSPSKKRLSQEESHTRFSNEVLTPDPLLQNSSQNTQSSQGPSQDTPTPPLLQSLEQIEDEYEVFLIDIVGTIHDGKKAFENSVQIINNLIKKDKTVAFISNTPRPHNQPAKTLTQMGLDTQIPVFTAGDIVRDDLKEKYKNKIIYHLGADCNQEILEGLNVQTTLDLEEASLVLLTQFVEEDESIDAFKLILEDIAARKLTVLCANSDKTATVGDKLRYCAGTLAEEIEGYAGIVEYYGKPNAKIFDRVISKLPNIQNVPKSKILVIGDTLEKDIKGANNCGIKSLLVLTGTTAQDIKKSGRDPKKALKSFCFHQQAKPTYYINVIE